MSVELHTFTWEGIRFVQVETQLTILLVCCLTFERL